MKYDLVEELLTEAECEVRRYCACKPKKIEGFTPKGDQWNMHYYDKWITHRTNRCGWHRDYDKWLDGETTGTTQSSEHPCDTCGGPSTHMARDMVDHGIDPSTRFRIRVPSTWRYGCEEHREESCSR